MLVIVGVGMTASAVAADGTRTVTLAAGQTEAYIPFIKQGERLKVTWVE
jgi:hypothetical protein